MSRPATPRQQEAIGTHDRSMVVTAGAGTGKTFVLVGKYLSLIEEQGLKPREILAMTFTDKAAAEMKERVRETVGRRLLSEPESQYWRAIAEEVIIAPIITFHSFCAQVLREFAIEAGIDPGFVILDGGQSQTIRRDTFDQLLIKPGDQETEEALIRVLAQVEQYRLHEMLTIIADHTDWFDKFFARMARDPEGIREEWQQCVRDVREPAIVDFFSKEENTRGIEDLLRFGRHYGGVKDSAVSYLGQVTPYLAEIRPDQQPTELSRAIRGFLSIRPKGRIGSQKNWDPEDLATFRRIKGRLTRALERLMPYADLILEPDAPSIPASMAFFADLSLISHRYQDQLTERKNQLNGLDFADLISLTRHFLQQNQDLVSRHLRPRIRSILVDEFQDTDPTQFEIICAIVGELCPDQNALFIVGDPKQSIYLFRDADVTRFKEAQRCILHDCSGRAINLDTSFRSSREVIGVVNHLFSAIFASAEKAWEFGYEPILTCEERRKNKGTVRVLLAEKAPSGTTTHDSKDIETGMVADMVHQIVSTGSMTVMDRDGTTRPAGYGDIAILIERRTYLSRYMDALALRGAPVYVHGGVGFYERQEIYDIYNLLSFLLRPYDDAALYGVLRSPYCSLSDAALFRVITYPGRHGGTLFDRIGQYVSECSPADTIGDEPEYDLMIRAVTRLSAWMTSAGREPLVLLITRIIRESGILTVYGAQEQGSQQIANLEKLVRIVRKRSETGGYGLWQLIHEMSVSIGNAEREGEAALDAISQTSVNIMTVHASKGLEFPIVILPDMGSSREGKHPSMLIGESHGCAGVRLPDPQHEWEISETPVYKALQLIRKEKEAAEKKRLFYVGATRARDHLIFCGKRPDAWVETVDEGATRIDWICTLLGITPEMADRGEPVTIDPGDGEDRIEVFVHTNAEQIADPGAEKPPEPLCPPSELAGCPGSREEGCRYPDTGNGRQRIWSLSRVIADDEIDDEGSGCRLIIPGAEALSPEETGTLLHQVFAGEPAGTVLLRAGVQSPDATRFCESRYEAFLRSPFMQTIVEHYCEVPFIITLGSIRIEGRMDRLCRRSDGSWMVIDYKSGKRSACTQMAVYKRAAHMLLGSPVEAALYHIGSDTISIPEDIPDDELILQLSAKALPISDQRQRTADPR